MGKQVKVYTNATNPDTGEVVNLAPGDSAPDWAELGDHVYADEDIDAVPSEPVAGPGQSALTKRQAAQLDAELEAATQEDGTTGNEQTRTSSSHNVPATAKAGSKPAAKSS